MGGRPPFFGGLTNQRSSRWQEGGIQPLRERCLSAASPPPRRTRTTAPSATCCTRGPTGGTKKDIKADLERKQREAIEKLEQKGDVVAPEVAPAPSPWPGNLPGRTKTVPLFYPTRTGLLSCGENPKQRSKVRPELKPHPNSNPVETQTIQTAATVEADPAGTVEACDGDRSSTLIRWKVSKECVRTH